MDTLTNILYELNDKFDTVGNTPLRRKNLSTFYMKLLNLVYSPKVLCTDTFGADLTCVNVWHSFCILCNHDYIIDTATNAQTRLVRISHV